MKILVSDQNFGDDAQVERSLAAAAGAELAVERGLLGLAAHVAAGGWNFRAAGPRRRLRGHTLGLLGFGRIARAVATRARSLGLRVAAHDPLVPSKEIRRLEATPLPFDELLAHADILSVHVPLTEETKGLVGADELARLPEGAVVLNPA